MAGQLGGTRDKLAEQALLLGQVLQQPSSSMASTVPSSAHATGLDPGAASRTAWWWMELTSISVAPRASARWLSGSIFTRCTPARARSVWS